MILTYCICGFILVECITALLWVFSRSLCVRKVSSWVAKPLLFVCYIAAILWFCVEHSDESFIRNITSNQTSFYTAMKELTEEPL